MKVWVTMESQSKAPGLIGLNSCRDGVDLKMQNPADLPGLERRRRLQVWVVEKYFESPVAGFSISAISQIKPINRTRFNLSRAPPGDLGWGKQERNHMAHLETVAQIPYRRGLDLWRRSHFLVVFLRPDLEGERRERGGTETGFPAKPLRLGNGSC